MALSCFAHFTTVHLNLNSCDCFTKTLDLHCADFISTAHLSCLYSIHRYLAVFQRCLYPPHRLTCFSDPTVVPSLREGNRVPASLDAGNAFVIESKQHWAGHRRGIGGKLGKSERFQEVPTTLCLLLTRDEEAQCVVIHTKTNPPF